MVLRVIEFPHAVIVEGAIAPARAAELRRDLVFERYVLLDRGSYEVAAVADERTIHDVLDRVGRELGLDGSILAVGARVVRLRPGGYLLARHDDVHAAIVTGNESRRRFELVLDLSPAPAVAEIHYRRRGQLFFRVPCVPGSLAIVERTATVTCNHAYVSKLAPAAEVVRLIVQAVA